MEIVERRWWDRDAVEQCNMQARRKAVRSVEQSLSRRGKGYGYWPAIRAEWEKFSQDPKRFDGVEGFKAAMAAKYGAEPGTLGNKITRWKRERDSHIGES